MLAVLFYFFTAPAFGQDAPPVDFQRADTDGHGALRLYDSQGKLVRVLVPVKNEKAREAVHGNKGKADVAPACSAPSAMIMNDLTGAADNIAANGAFLALQTYDQNGGGVNLGFLVLWNGQGFYLDGETDASGRPLTIHIANPGWLPGDFTINAGESVNISHNGGSMTITFPVSISVGPQGTSGAMFVDTTGRLFSDAALTQPLDGKTCP